MGQNVTIKVLPDELLIAAAALGSGVVAYYKPRQSVEAGAVSGAAVGWFYAVNTSATHKDGSACRVIFPDEECEQRQRDRIAAIIVGSAAAGAAVGAINRWARSRKK